MRIPDQRWWARLLVASAYALVPVFFGAIVLGFAVGFGISPSAFSLGDTLKLAALCLLLVVICFDFAFIFGRDALLRRMRYRQRVHALDADIAALPLAATTVREGDLPDLAAQPLELLWERNPDDHHWSRFDSFTAWLLVVAVALCGVLVIVVAPHLNGPGVGESAVVALIGVGVLLLVGAGVLLATYLCCLRPARGRFGIIASMDGLTEVRRNGNTVTVPWDEARLFEVEGRRARHSGSAAVTAYRLYGQRGVVEWKGFLVLGSDLDPPVIQPAFLPIDRSYAQMARRYETLAALIPARTGLQPRTLSPALQALA